MQYNIHDAKTRLFQLLDLVAQGESVVIAKDGVPVAELVPYRREGVRLGAGVGDGLVNQIALSDDRWWKAMDDQEAEEFLDGSASPSR
jgi:prevent-host-death family protein